MERRGGAEPGEAARESTAREGRGDPGAALREALAAIPLGHAESFRKTVSEADVYAFAGITGDFSPVHVDEEFCKGTRFGTRIAHGALLVGFVSTVMAKMTARLPPPGGVSYRYDVEFVAPVRPGDTIAARLVLVEVRPERRELVFEARCTNQGGQTVLEGRTVLKLI